MLDHLVGPEPDVQELASMSTGFTPVDKASPQEILEAQYFTNDWLAELGAPDDEEISEEQQRQAAQEAFTSLTANADPSTQREALLTLRSPAAHAKFNSMLSAYEWEFVGRAQQLRTMAVSKIVDELDNRDPRIRLRAAELLGKVTEVALFTERVEVKKVDASDAEIEQRLREKLEKYLKANAIPVEATPVPAALQQTDTKPEEQDHVGDT